MAASLPSATQDFLAQRVRSVLNQPIVGLAGTSSGNGYWLVASDGGIFAFGDARFFGSTGAMKLNQPIVGMSATKSGQGYWLVASDGGVFSYGDARFFGSTGAMKLNQPVVGISVTGTGNGYWMVASDGGIFAYGDAPFLGSNAGANQEVYGITKDAANGYYLLQRNGTVIHFLNSALVDLPPIATGGGTGTPPTTAPPTTTPPTTTTAPPVNNTPNTSNPFANRSLFSLPWNPATAQAAAWSATRPADAALMARMGNTPTAAWFGGWNTNVESDVSSVVSLANATNAMPTLVAYNIPSRDCGSYSAGGAANAAAYTTWIDNFAAGIGNGRAAVVLEPDALAGIDCLDADGQASRYALLSHAVDVSFS